MLTLHASPRLAGAGTALLSGVQAVARRAGCRRLWVVTTNDNVDALRFYQRRGLRLAHLRPGAVDESRKALKPEIPQTGSHHIPLRDDAGVSSCSSPTGDGSLQGKSTMEGRSLPSVLNV